jgi:hypothetical protein
MRHGAKFWRAVCGAILSHFCSQFCTRNRRKISLKNGSDFDREMQREMGSKFDSDFAGREWKRKLDWRLSLVVNRDSDPESISIQRSRFFSAESISISLNP